MNAELNILNIVSRAFSAFKRAGRAKRPWTRLPEYCTPNIWTKYSTIRLGVFGSGSLRSAAILKAEKALETGLRTESRILTKNFRKDSFLNFLQVGVEHLCNWTALMSDRFRTRWNPLLQKGYVRFRKLPYFSNTLEPGRLFKISAKKRGEGVLFKEEHLLFFSKQYRE